MDPETAVLVLIETAQAYLETNQDDGVLEPDHKERIEAAIEMAKSL